MRTLLDEARIRGRIDAMGAEIAAALPEAARNDLLLVGPLKGAVLFMSDLSRALSRAGVALHGMDYVGLSSYGAGTVSKGEVTLVSDLRMDVADRHVLLVDDIVDTGRTLHFAQRYLRDRRPASLRTATLLDKPSRRVVEVPVEHVGFTIDDVFVVGYGTDYAERYRELPFVGILRE